MYDNVNHWHEATCEHTDVKGDEAEHTLVHTEAKAPTCTEKGWDAYDTCSVCKYTTYVEKAATGHTFETAWTTDEDNHWHKATCEHTSEVSEKGEHDWASEITTEPGYGTTGVETYTCKVCSKTKTKELPALQPKENTISYTGATSKDYDGEELALESSKISVKGERTVKIEYKAETDTSYTTTAPKDAGTYNVKLSVAATKEWKAAELVITYTINKKTLTVPTLRGPALYYVLAENQTKRTVAIGPRYGAAENFEIVLNGKEIGSSWSSTTPAITFHSKSYAEANSLNYYYEMDEEYSKNYELESVTFDSFKDSNQVLAAAYLITEGTTYTKTGDNIFTIREATTGATYIISISSNVENFTLSDRNGNIFCPDENNQFTMKSSTAASTYLYLCIFSPGDGISYTFSISKAED